MPNTPEFFTFLRDFWRINCALIFVDLVLCLIVGFMVFAIRELWRALQ